MKQIYVLMFASFVVNTAMAQWIPQNSGTTQNLNAVYFTDANTGYVAGDSGIILKTSDGGNQWIILNSGATGELRSIYFITPVTGYIAGDDVILKTEDMGSTWTDISPPGLVWTGLESVHFPIADTGYVVGRYGMYGGLFLKTINGGTTWTVDSTRILESVFFTDASIGYIAENFCGWESCIGHIRKTINGGSDWSDWTDSTQFSTDFHSIFFTNEFNGFAVCGVPMGSGGFIYKTTDAGETWTGSPHIWMEMNSVFFADSDTGYIVGYVGNGLHHGSILKTTDGGINWSDPILLPTNEFQYLNSIYFTDGLTGYVVGEGGIILKTINGGSVGLNESIDASIFPIFYPNPALGKITIPTSAKGHLSILNLCGQVIQQEEISEINTTIDVSGLSGGVYFVRLTCEGTVKVGKMIKN